MENKENNSSELKKKIIETINTLQEILDIADQVEDNTDKMADYNRPDFVDDLLSDSIKSDSIPKKTDMRHWASTLSDRVWEKFREDAIAVGDLH